MQIGKTCAWKKQTNPFKNYLEITLAVGKDMIQEPFDERYIWNFFTYISDFPDFSHDFIASNLLFDAIFPMANSMDSIVSESLLCWIEQTEQKSLFMELPVKQNKLNGIINQEQNLLYLVFHSLW